MATVSGAYGVGDPPVPIPNTEVKTHCGNNTWTTRSWQDSTVPDLNTKPTPPTRSVGGGYAFKTHIKNGTTHAGKAVTRERDRSQGDPPPSASPNTEARDPLRQQYLDHKVQVCCVDVKSHVSKLIDNQIYWLGVIGQSLIELVAELALVRFACKPTTVSNIAE